MTATATSGIDHKRELGMEFKDKYGPWALIAGASEGLGVAFAMGAAERGCDVILVARTESKLAAVAGEIERTRRSGSHTGDRPE